MPSLCVVWQLVPQHDGVAHSHPSRSGAVFLLQSERPVLQVYEQVVPLQLGVPVVALHALPQAPQLLVVLSSVQVVPPHSVSRQVHEPLEQSGAGCVHVAWFTQLPVAPHVCGVLPMQLV